MPLSRQIHREGLKIGVEFKVSKEHLRRGFQLAVKDTHQALRTGITTEDRLGNHLL